MLRQPKSADYKAGFAKGRKNGIWLAYHKIFPVPTQTLSKDLAREAAGLAGMKNRGHATHQELRQYLIDHGHENVIFKPGDGKVQLV